MAIDERETQREYYARTAARYDDCHGAGEIEHEVAGAFLQASIDLLSVRSVLDVGAGTGRVIRRLKERNTGLQAIGVEPVEELREQGYAKGLSREALVPGDATALAFADEQFDLVSAFAVLHHVRRPEKVVSEMIRVAARAVFIADANCYGQGTGASRFSKAVLRRLGLWRAACMIRTGGRGYFISEGDGLFYPFSVFDMLPLIQKRCKRIHILNTMGSGASAIRTAPHVAILAVKE